MKTIDHIASQNDAVRCTLADYRNYLEKRPVRDILGYVHGRVSGALLTLYSAGLISAEEHDLACAELREMKAGVKA